MIKDAIERRPIKVLDERRGFVNREVNDLSRLLAQNKGRWVKIHRDYLRPSYLYRYNRGQESIGERITMRGVAAAMRGDEDFYYAMMMAGGVATTVTFHKVEG